MRLSPFGETAAGTVEPAAICSINKNAADYVIEFLKVCSG